jgi:hexokinase
MPEHSLSDFINSNRLTAESISPTTIIKDLINEMEKGLAGNKSSLAMLPSYINTDFSLPLNTPVIALDAGGTNFRVAVISFRENNRIDIEDYQTYMMPGIESEVSKKEFFNIIADYVKPLLSRSERIGFCFSYPVEITNDNDGKLLYFTKEINAPEVIGNYICRSLREALSGKGFKDRWSFTLLNDAVATLLAGKADSSSSVYDSYIGFILGTGSNTAYIEDGSKILKEPSLSGRGYQIINAESGMFNLIPRNKIDEEFDSKTNNPGNYIFEKMVSGAYLGSLTLEYLKSAADFGLFSKSGKKIFGSISEFGTKDMNAFLFSTTGRKTSNIFSSLSGADRKAATVIMEAVVERAAILAAINLAAFILKSGKGARPEKPVCITAEGSTLYRVKDFKEKMESHLSRILIGEYERYFKVIKIENAPLIGAAIAGLTAHPVNS